jgi:large subunit ribosomal protein L22
VAAEVLKTLRSAIANAENNHGLDTGSLYISQAFVGQSFRLRRSMARGRGHGGSVRKPFSHLSIIVAEREV